MTRLWCHLLLLLLVVPVFAGCAGTNDMAKRNGAHVLVHNILPPVADDPAGLAALAPAAGGVLAVAELPFATMAPLPGSTAFSCSGSRRFESADILAVDLDGGQSRLGLGLNAGAVDYDRTADAGYQEAMLNLRVRLQPVAVRRPACALAP